MPCPGIPTAYGTCARVRYSAMIWPPLSRRALELAAICSWTLAIVTPPAFVRGRLATSEQAAADRARSALTGSAGPARLPASLDTLGARGRREGAESPPARPRAARTGPPRPRSGSPDRPGGRTPARQPERLWRVRGGPARRAAGPRPTDLPRPRPDGRCPDRGRAESEPWPPASARPRPRSRRSCPRGDGRRSPAPARERARRCGPRFPPAAARPARVDRRARTAAGRPGLGARHPRRRPTPVLRRQDRATTSPSSAPRPPAPRPARPDG